MSDVEQRKRGKSSFSLLTILILTAVIALGTALGMTLRKNQSLKRRFEELSALSGRLEVEDERRLDSAEMPRIADDYFSWQVHVPKQDRFELRLGIGEMSKNGVPPLVGSVPIPAGQHRVTLYTGDSTDDDFLYRVYLDGKQVIEERMGRMWMPEGWSMARGMGWIGSINRSPYSLQLASETYTADRDFGQSNYFNGQSDNYVTRKGYRLWIDQADRSYEPASPFIGLPGDINYLGFGLRDGLRFTSSNGAQPQVKLTRPKLRSNNPVLVFAAGFRTTDGKVLPWQNQSWSLSSEPTEFKSVEWQEDPQKSIRTAYLVSGDGTGGSPKPVIEVKWDADRPDEVGLRLADTPGNENLDRWQVRVLEGYTHLWQEVQFGDKIMTPSELLGGAAELPAVKLFPLDFAEQVNGQIEFQWRSDETLPLQIVQRQKKLYAGMPLYDGLPTEFGALLPAALQPQVAVEVSTEMPNAAGTPMPGGAVFTDLEIDLSAAVHEWIWLTVRERSDP